MEEGEGSRRDKRRKYAKKEEKDEELKKGRGAAKEWREVGGKMERWDNTRKTRRNRKWIKKKIDGWKRKRREK